MYLTNLATFLHVSVDPILGDVHTDIVPVFFDIFARFSKHHKKHGFLIVKWPLSVPTRRAQCFKYQTKYIYSRLTSHSKGTNYSFMYLRTCP
jgi:hypothetical protein